MSLFDDDLFDDDNNQIDITENIIRNAIKKATDHLYTPIYIDDKAYTIDNSCHSEPIGLLASHIKDEMFGILLFSETTPKFDYLKDGIVKVTCLKKEEISSSDWSSLVAKAIERKEMMSLEFLTSFPPRETNEVKFDDEGLNCSFFQKGVTLKMVKDTISYMDQIQLPDDLKEDKRNTFGDLHNSIDVVRFLNEKPEGNDGPYHGSDVLGYYIYNDGVKEIVLYLETIWKHYCQLSAEDQERFEYTSYIKMVYIHELYHAYFDIYKKEVSRDIEKYIEEPIVEYVTLQTLEKCKFHEVAKRIVESKLDGRYRQYGLGASDIGMDNVVKYKYMKYMFEDDDIKTYTDTFSTDDFSPENSLKFLKRVFMDSEQLLKEYEEWEKDQILFSFEEREQKIAQNIELLPKAFEKTQGNENVQLYGRNHQILNNLKDMHSKGNCYLHIITKKNRDDAVKIIDAMSKILLELMNHNVSDRKKRKELDNTCIALGSFKRFLKECW